MAGVSPNSVDGLDRPCPACGRPAGDHTVREWAACIDVPTTDLPFERSPDDAVRAAAEENLRARFEIDENVRIADNIATKALVLHGAAGPLAVKIPALLHDFSVGVAGGPPSPVASVLFIGPIDVMRQYGRLVRDSANGAANAAERA